MYIAISMGDWYNTKRNAASIYIIEESGTWTRKTNKENTLIEWAGQTENKRGQVPGKADNYGKQQSKRSESTSDGPQSEGDVCDFFGMYENAVCSV